MRIGLMGHNSVEFIEQLIRIWNNNDSAVLIDYDMPVDALKRIISNNLIASLRVEESLFLKFGSDSIKVNVEPYSVCAPLPCFLPDSIYDKYTERYDEDEAVVIFSSGTTGLNKGISLSHRALNNNADSIIHYMQPKATDCLYLNKKITHSSSLTGELLVALKGKFKIVVAPIVIPPRIAFRIISDFGVSILCCNPALLKMYVDEVERANRFPEVIKTIYTSGDVISVKAIERARSVFTRPVYNVYGQTECGPRISAQTEDCCRGNSVGKPIKNVEIKIDTSGEVLVKTNALFSGYAASAAEAPGEWHGTGDLGFIDENGELYITGRTNSLIVIGAHNIYPEAVEQTIIENTAISDCLVYKDVEKLACDYVTAGDINPMDVIRSLKQLLMPYEVPSTYRKVKSISRNTNGKKVRKNNDQIR